MRDIGVLIGVLGVVVYLGFKYRSKLKKIKFELNKMNLRQK